VEEGAVEEGVVENGAGEEGAAEDAVNLEVPVEPPRSTLSFEWGENWTSSSQLGRFFSQYAKPNMENDTNLGIRTTKLRSRSGSVLPPKRSNRKRGKVRRRKTTTKTTRKMRKRRWTNWQSQCQSSGR
jgi:hypothetical protein